jgi:hydrogenase expression/formation protein HypE
MKFDRIMLDHGSGGIMSHDLTKQVFLPAFSNKVLNNLDDGAVLDLKGKRIAFSTDTYVVDPIFFPGGSIGDLAINGTVNDISMCGGIPSFLSVGLIIEENFPLDQLKRIVDDMRLAAQKANVKVVTGDTKVVPRGTADKIFINTSGIGLVSEDINLSSRFAKPGDLIIISGTMADHGMTIMTQRQGFNFSSNIKSDTAPLNGIVTKIIETDQSIHVLRDPTRGGVGTSLNEIAQKSKVGIRIFEKNLPIKSEVSSICDLLGFDPMYVANEGKFLAFVPSKNASKVLSIIKSQYLGRDACVIGEVIDDHPGQVSMKTCIGGERVIDMLTGEQLPRIC